MREKILENTLNVMSVLLYTFYKTIEPPLLFFEDSKTFKLYNSTKMKNLNKLTFLLTLLYFLLKAILEHVLLLLNARSVFNPPYQINFPVCFFLLHERLSFLFSFFLIWQIKQWLRVFVANLFDQTMQKICNYFCIFKNNNLTLFAHIYEI